MTNDHNREELIEQIMDELHPHGLWNIHQEEHQPGTRAKAERLLAVFEQAHTPTPTDDEREARGFSEAQWPDLGFGGSADHLNRIARARFLEGVEWQSRRTVQGGTEWEYGNEMLMNNHTQIYPASSEFMAKAQAWLWPMYRRRKAGLWMPVPDTTKTENGSER